MTQEQLEKKIILLKRKNNILKKDELYCNMVEEFQAYEYKLYQLQDEILEKKGGKLLEKEEILGKEFNQDEEDKRQLLELFKKDIVFK